jgi:hypothetical protein
MYKLIHIDKALSTLELDICFKDFILPAKSYLEVYRKLEELSSIVKKQVKLLSKKYSTGSFFYERVLRHKDILMDGLMKIEIEVTEDELLGPYRVYNADSSTASKFTKV